MPSTTHDGGPAGGDAGSTSTGGTTAATDRSAIDGNPVVDGKATVGLSFAELAEIAAGSPDGFTWGAETASRRADVDLSDADPSPATGIPTLLTFEDQVNRQARFERIRREARRRVDEVEQALIDADVELSDDWQPSTPAELHDRFAGLVGAEWVEDISPKGAKGNVFGPSMSAKTVFLHYVALAGANAAKDGTSSVFGRKIAEPFGTLIVALEDGQNQHARLDGIARAHGWKTDGVLVAVPDDLPHIKNPASLARVAAAARAAATRLDGDLGLPLGQILIDTGKYLIAGEDSNSTQAHSLVTALMARLTRITDGAYVAVVTHTPLSDDSRAVGSHDQQASRDHEIGIKNNALGTRTVTLSKHKFSENIGTTIGQFAVVPVETPFSPRTVPGLVERGTAAAGFAVGAAAVAAEASKQYMEVDSLVAFLLVNSDGDGWVAQATIYETQANGGFGRKRAEKVRDLLDAIDSSMVEVGEFSLAKTKAKRWRLRPGLDRDALLATAREALSLDA